ncbi:MAG: APC family permease [Isosphaeraceae bacterium]|nr:APC family permease [Isosphaeraceae bacterium]
MLQRRLRLLQAVSLNMSTMVGMGPFITIPALVGSLGGPQALLGWFLGALVALCDGLVWSELAAAFPGSGGTYHFFDAIYGDTRVGRLLKFLFVWQFLFSAPLEVATGAIGLAQYIGYLWPALKGTAWRVSAELPGLGSVDWRVGWSQVLAMGVLGAITVLAYRRIEVAGRLLVILWLGMLATVALVIVAGFSNFDHRLAFDFPPDAWALDRHLFFGLGGALGIAMYDYLGYYQVCYLGDEVADPERTLPRSIMISVLVIALAYIVMNAGILGVLPWRDVVRSEHVATDMVLKLYGQSAARVVTWLIVWSAVASTFGALLGYSRVPYAAARAGHFFRGLAKTHPRGNFPHRSLLAVSALATLACLADLGTVIAALLTSRILVQFGGQIATVFYVRSRPDLAAQLRFRMALFPLPTIIALAGWLYVFGTSEFRTVLYGLVSLGLGLAVFALWDHASARPRKRPATSA